MSLGQVFTKGFIKENPIFKLLLGLCPTLAVTSSVDNGLGMGLATTAVLVAANVVISALRKVIPVKIRIPCFIVVIATFVTLVGMVMEAFVPALFASLGLFIPLIVVNCLILGRAEAFASKNGVLYALIDGIGMGLGFTLGLCLLAAFREVLGAGSFFGYALFGEGFQPALIMILPPGAFLTMGCLLGVMNAIEHKKQ